MNTFHHSRLASDQPCGSTGNTLPTAIGTLAFCLSCLVASPAAADGCTVLLCLAAPSWRSIPQCVPPVRKLLRDLARGKSFPTCAMAGAANSASHTWSSAPGNCPPQYTRINHGPNGPIYTCDFAGAISLSVEGVPFATTWWSMSGDAVTQFSPSAKARLGSWDTRFDDELAAWLATGPTQTAPNN